MQHHKAVVTIFACVVVSACALPPHSNALLFATNTTIALDVSASPTAGTPNVTIGYKRQEFAWVPLLANTGSTAAGSQDRPAFGCSKPGVKPDKTPDPNADYTDCVFKGTSSNGDSDSYSVMASLNGGTSITTNSGVTTNATIGQYFATGLAARYLAEKGGAQLVNPNATPAGAGAKAADLQVQDQANEAAITAALADPFATSQSALLAAANAEKPPISEYDATKLGLTKNKADFLAYTAGKYGLRQSLADAARTLKPKS